MGPTAPTPELPRHGCLALEWGAWGQDVGTDARGCFAAALGLGPPAASSSASAIPVSPAGVLLDVLKVHRAINTREQSCQHPPGWGGC